MAVSQGWRFAERTRAGAGDGITAILGLLANPDLISFAGGFPDPRTFPAERVAELARELDARAFQYAPTQGLEGTRDAVAGRLDRRPEEGELLITSGGIEALELVSKSFLDPGDAVVVEAPTYVGAIMAFRSFEADVHAEPSGTLRPKLVYTIPDHRNPSGTSLSVEEREALVEQARRDGFLIVEDVAYRELGFDGTAPPSLWSLGPDVVVQIGTTSKTFFPGVRLGWAAGPAEVVAQMTSAKQNTDQCSGALGQRLFEEYVRRGWIDEQLRASRALYAQKWELLREALGQFMPEDVRWTEPRGGFFTWLTLPGRDATEVAARAAERNVGVVPGPLFFPDGRGGENVRLSFSMVDESQIATGVELLASAL
ncbi:MAG: PLP-dependent aminotransferase family protein [Actinomycetota bacterium]